MSHITSQTSRDATHESPRNKKTETLREVDEKKRTHSKRFKTTSGKAVLFDGKGKEKGEENCEKMKWSQTSQT